VFNATQIKILIATFFFATVVLFAYFRLKESPSPHGIAIVGEQRIDFSIVERSFQLEPKWGKGLTRKQAYYNQLNFLIDQKLLAHEVRKMLEKKPDETLRGMQDFIRRKESIKALYRDEVAAKVFISGQEYEDAYGKLKRKVRLRYFSTPDSLAAIRYYAMLQMENFENISLANPVTERKVVSGWMTFGDLVPLFESFVFDLQPGQVWKPQKSDGVWYVVQLADSRVEKFTSAYDFALKKNHLRKIIFERRASKIANTFIKELMEDKDVRLKTGVFNRLYEYFERVVQKRKEQPNAVPPVNLTDDELNRLSSRVEDIKNLTLATHKNGRLTVGEFLKRLSYMPDALRPKVALSTQLKNAIGVIIRNDYLYELAKKRGLDKLPAVQKEIQYQSDRLLAAYWRDNQAKHITVSDRELDSLRNTSVYKKLKKQFTKEPQKAQLEAFLREQKMLGKKIALLNSLRKQYTIRIDSLEFEKKISDLDKTITYDPAPMIVREQFN